MYIVLVYVFAKSVIVPLKQKEKTVFHMFYVLLE